MGDMNSSNRYLLNGSLDISEYTDSTNSEIHYRNSTRKMLVMLTALTALTAFTALTTLTALTA